MPRGATSLGDAGLEGLIVPEWYDEVYDENDCLGGDIFAPEVMLRYWGSISRKNREGDVVQVVPLR